MRKYFNVKIQFNKDKVDETIQETIHLKNKGYVCLVNSNNFTTAYKSEFHSKVLNNSLLNLCDGSVMALILSIIHRKKLTAYSGPDLFIKYLKEKKYSYLFLGSTKEILNALNSNLKKINPNLSDIYFLPLPYKKDVNDFDYLRISHQINLLDVDIIWVSLGAPKQEQFMYKLIPYLNRGILIGVGAAFLFYSGIKKYKRPSSIYKRLRLEWLIRLFREPKRISSRFFPQIPIIFKLIIKEIKDK